LLVSILRSDTGPSTLAPLNNVPEGSICDPSSFVRHCPTASKFSSENPSGSINLWQPLHGSFARCCSMRSRKESFFAPASFSLRAGTFGGGGLGGFPNRFVRIHFPRSTAEV